MGGGVTSSANVKLQAVRRIVVAMMITKRNFMKNLFDVIARSVRCDEAISYSGRDCFAPLAMTDVTLMIFHRLDRIGL